MDKNTTTLFSPLISLKQMRCALGLFWLDIRHHWFFWLTFAIVIGVLAHYTGLYFYLIMLPLTIVIALIKTRYFPDSEGHKNQKQVLIEKCRKTPKQN
jgi:hypothetical protein